MTICHFSKAVLHHGEVQSKYSLHFMTPSEAVAVKIKSPAIDPKLPFSQNAEIQELRQGQSGSLRPSREEIQRVPAADPAPASHHVEQGFIPDDNHLFNCLPGGGASPVVSDVAFDSGQVTLKGSI